MIKYGDKTYAFDINKMMEWCFQTSNQLFKETEINEDYAANDNGEIEIKNKAIREIKTSNNQIETIRYDFIKTLINPFIANDSVLFMDSKELTFSETIIINTLLELGFLIEINED